MRHGSTGCRATTPNSGPISADAPAFPKGFAAMGPLRTAAEEIGSGDFSAHYCGQSAALGRRTTAFALTRDLASDALRRFRLLAPSRSSP